MKDRSSAAISQAAHRLIVMHGEEAPTVAARHASHMEKLGDVRRRTNWLCIMIKAQKMLVSERGW
jgi:hypothetical protein